jgi:hypothetical protein
MAGRPYGSSDDPADALPPRMLNRPTRSICADGKYGTYVSVRMSGLASGIGVAPSGVGLRGLNLCALGYQSRSGPYFAWLRWTMAS